MSHMTQIAARIDAQLIGEVDKTAREDRRNRSAQIAELLEIGLAGRRRLKELERLAAEGVARSTLPHASDAGLEHLAEHRRLAGLPPEK